MKKRYDSYKPSGIDWIGDIPSHWNIRKTSQLFQGIGSGTTPTSGSNKYYCENGINWLQTGDLNDGQIIETSKKLTELAIKDFSSLRLYPKASIVIAMYGATIGKLGILNIQTTTNQACCVLPYSKGINPNFGFYAYRAGKQSLINSAYGGGQPNISQETIKSFRIALPPLAEQEAIAAWLDTQCEEIDAAIAKVDREIELIDELKQSEISRVVTRGLNPDTPLRPSGIDWIGDIPEHWEICRIKHKADVVLGKMLLNEPPKEQRNIYSKEKYLKSRNIGWLNLLLDEVDEMWFNESEKSLYKLNDGDVLVNEGGDIGKVAIWHNQEDSFYIQNSVHKISPIGVTSGFLVYWIFSLSKRDYFWSIVSQVSIAHLTKEKLSNTPLIVPPLAEQQAIADYLDKKCAEIDGLKAKLNRKRETLTELRQSIISEVVTGKRKVI